MLASDETPIGQRFRQLLAGDGIDRPLVWLYGAVPSFAVRIAGYDPVAAYNDPAKAFDAQIKTTAMFGDDGIPRMAVGGASDVTWAFGGEIRWPTGEYDMAPVAVRHPVNCEADAEALELPADIAASGPLPLYRQMAELQSAHGFPVFPFLTSPIEGARSLCGPELLMRWMIRRPELAHRMLRLATDYSLGVARWFAGRYNAAEVIPYLAAPTASNQMISPKLFEKFVLPYQQEFHREALAAGIRHIYCHICGEQNRNLPLWEQVPMGEPGIVSFGHEVDLSVAIRCFGKHCIVAGNVEPARIHLGPAGDVYRLSREALQKGRRAPRGFILMPGCGIAHQVPVYHVYLLLKAHRDFLVQPFAGMS